MKEKIISIIVGIACVSALFLTSCTKQDHYFKDYIIERTYVGMPDSIWIEPGDGRALIGWRVPKDGQAKDMIIRWSSNDSIVVAIDHNANKQDVIIDGLDERDYVFTAYTTDRLENYSLRMELSAPIFGENYRRSIRERVLSHSVVFPADSIALVWNNLGQQETLFGVEIEFTDKEGSRQNAFSSASEELKILNNVDTDQKISFTTVYRPHENAFDNFYMDPVMIDLLETKRNTMTFSSDGYLDAVYVDFNLLRTFLIDKIPRPVGEVIDMCYALGAGSRGNLFAISGTGFSAFASIWQDQITNWSVRNYAGMKMSTVSVYESLDERDRSQMISAYEDANADIKDRLFSLAVNDVVLLHSADREIYVAMKVLGTPPPVNGALGDFVIEFKISRP